MHIGGLVHITVPEEHTGATFTATVRAEKKNQNRNQSPRRAWRHPLQITDNTTQFLSNRLEAQKQSLSPFVQTMTHTSASSQLPSHFRRSTRSSLADGATLGA